VNNDEFGIELKRVIGTIICQISKDGKVIWKYQ